MKYKAFVLNLKTDVKRRDHIERQLKKLGIDYEVIEAVVGKDLSPENNPEIDWDFATKNAYWVSKGLLGCTLSHLKAYQAIADQNLDFGLVLEDDTNLDKRLPEFLNKVGDHLLPNENMLLYYKSFKKCQLKKEKDLGWLNFKIARPVNPHQLIAGNAYIMTKAACITALAFQKPLKATPDQWWVYHKNGGIENIRCLYPHLAEAADFKSSIDYINQKTWRGKLLLFINKYEVFPLYQIIKLRRWMRKKQMMNFELIE